MQNIPFNGARFKEVAGDCAVEFCNYLPRGKNGLRTWEIKAVDDDGSCKIVVLRDCGFNIAGEVIEITPFNNRAERNKLIVKLYHEKGLSQVFLAEFFHISQPAVSLIVSRK